MAEQYRVLVEKFVLTEVAKLDKPMRRRIQAALLALAAEPRPPGVVALVGAPGTLRIGVGVHRIVYTVRDRERLVLAIDIDHHRRAYRSE